MPGTLKISFFLLPLVVLLPTAHGEAPPVPNLQIFVALVDSNLDVKPVPKPVPKFLLEAESVGTGQVYRGSTGFDGELELAVPAGRYIIRSVEPAQLEGRTFSWQVEAEVSADGSRRVELSNDNAIAGKRAGTPAEPSRPLRPRDRGLTWSVGGGVVGSVADPEFGNDIDGQGVFFTAQVMLDSGVIFQFSSSATEDDESGSVNDELLRAGFTAGYMFRLNSTVRPFVHGGLSFIGVEEDVGGVDVIDDDSETITIGAGLVAGSGHHNFFLDVVRDIGHEVSDALGVGIESEFDLTEAHLGYAYRF